MLGQNLLSDVSESIGRISETTKNDHLISELYFFNTECVLFRISFSVQNFTYFVKI